MQNGEFKRARSILDKTQAEMALLLGLSVRAVHSYEQNWRNIPAYVERQVYFLLSRRSPVYSNLKPCWEVKNCPERLKNKCPAWEFHSGNLCWFINGTQCQGKNNRSWDEKIVQCRKCVMLKKHLDILVEP